MKPTERNHPGLRTVLHELVQGIEHRQAGNADKAAEGLVQLQNQENSTGNGESGDGQSEDGRGVRRCEYAKAEENDHEP